MAVSTRKQTGRTEGLVSYRPLVGVIDNYWGIAALIIAWQLFVVITNFNTIVMPTPIGVVNAIVSAPEVFISAALITFAMAVAGLLLGAVVGSALAMAAWFSPVAAGILTPLTILFSSVPVVAFIPIIARLFGYDTSTVLAIVVIISFFPTFVFVSAGLRAVPLGSNDLFRVFGASRFATLWYLSLPAALPSFAVGMRIAAAQCMLAAMVAEFLMGTAGLGYLFQLSKSDFDMERAFGTSLLATIVSVTMFVVANKLETRINARWT
jgi:NitT/TauT family transport system permease protein